MASKLAYDARIFTPAGPRLLRCMVCGTRVSSNALARAAHERSDGHRRLVERRQERLGLGYMQGRGAS